MEHETLPGAPNAGVPDVQHTDRTPAIGGEAPPPPAVQVAPAPEPPAVYKPGPTITVNRKELLKKLTLLFRVIAKGPIPILNNILVTSRDGEATAIATNTDVHMSVPLGAPLPAGTAFTLSRPVLKLVSNAFVDDIALQVFTRKLKYETTYQVQVGPIRFDSYDPKEFPPCRELWPDIERRASAEFTGFQQVLPAVSQDETRYNLSGVYFRLCKYEMVATDGHRLHARRIERELSGTGDFLVPPLFLKLAESAAAKGAAIRVDFHQQEKPKKDERVRKSVVTTIGDFRIAAACIDGEFPDYRHVIPEAGQPNAVTLRRKEMLAAVGQAMAITDDRARGIKLELGAEGVTIKGKHPDKGEFEMKVAGATRGENPFCLNARYLLAALEAATSEEVTLEWLDEASPLRLEDGPFLAVVMPMRL